MKQFALAALMLCLEACAAIQPASKLDRRLQQLAGLYVGDYQSPKGSADPVFMSVRAISPPPGAQFALYQVIRAGNAQGPISRQRLFLFDEAADRTTNKLLAYSFTDETAARELRTDASLVQSGALRFKPALGDGDCPMTFRMDGPDRFIGVIRPDQCVITGKSGERRRIEAAVMVSSAGLESLERGYDDAGKLLFGDPSGRRYIWKRIVVQPAKADENPVP